MDDVQGRCVGCGYLGRWNPDENRHLEVDQHCRNTGEATGALKDAKGRFSCVIRAAHLPSEQDDLAATVPNAEERLLLVIRNDRRCPEFMRHLPGFSPKEHVEMVHAKMLRDEIEQRRVADKKEDFRQRVFLAFVPIVAGAVGWWLNDALSKPKPVQVQWVAPPAPVPPVETK